MRRMGFAWRITEAADAVRLCDTYCFSTATVVTQTRLIVTLCVNGQSVSKITLYVIWWGDWKMVDWKEFGRGQRSIIPVLSWNLWGRTEEEKETFWEWTGIAVDSRTRFPPCAYEARAFPLPQHFRQCYCNKSFSGFQFLRVLNYVVLLVFKCNLQISA